ncbi:TadE/TadG family type IV pilus assembly protein [Pseudoduganella dura]|uniref:TadE/TadG family type IV pilus assembly protein n=1 Tax=Pseudoduganella dura TaxID=321982 RepID=UPI0015651E47|nr:TadE family protein [Pseudoduganella dura]GGX90636.1 hypothetical protein GCM10007386_21850 [Pseudoduganella dura]
MNVSRYRERGTAAIELAVVMSLGMLVLATIVLFGRFTWHLIAMEKSVYNAARIIAARPIEQVSGTGAATRMREAGSALVNTAARSSGIDIVPGDTVEARCNNGACGITNLTQVTVTARTEFADTIFNDGYTFDLLGLREGAALDFDSELDYVP